MSAVALPWPDACDCHIHVFEDRFALAPTATFKPPHAPASAYREVQRALGTGRAVVVQPTGYGFDNRCTLEAMASLGPGARGIAVVPPGMAEHALGELDAAGMRGVRYMMLGGGVLGWDTLEAIAQRIAPLRWTINLQLNGQDLAQHEARLAKLPARLVIDHLGKFLGPLSEEDAGFLSLRRLLDGGNCWVKLSAPYESSRSGPPDYADRAWIIQALARDYPERCLWASNWPHPNVSPTPSDEALLRWALQLMGSEAAQRRILVENPARLYGWG